MYRNVHGFKTAVYLQRKHIINFSRHVAVGVLLTCVHQEHVGQQSNHITMFHSPLLSLQKDAKYDLELEGEARQWIKDVLGRNVFGDKSGADHMHEVLGDGKVLVE